MRVSATRDLANTRSAAALVRRGFAAPGLPLNASTRSLAETRFGFDFSNVRVHSDRPAASAAAALGARAFTVGSDIVLGDAQGSSSDGFVQSLVMHELTHVAQDKKGIGSTDSAALELEADRSANLARSPITTASLRLDGLPLHRKPAHAPSPELEFAMVLTLDPLSVENVKTAFEAFKNMPAKVRAASLDTALRSGDLAKLLRALPKDAAIATYSDELREMLRFVEETSVRSEAGKTDDAIAVAQAAYSDAEAKKAAAAKSPGGAPPTPKEVEEARQEAIAKSSIPASSVLLWPSMDAATKAMWTSRAAAVAIAVTNYASKFPELKVTAANFKADFLATEKRGVGVLAFDGGTPSARVAVFGFDFVRAAEVDPGYALGIVVHELFGHHEYGPRATEYDLKLFDAAQQKIKGYVRPPAGSKARETEIDAFSYQETEIYALLRSLPYSKSIVPADSKKGLVGYEPAEWAKARIGVIKSQWEPKLAVAIVRGLFQRLLLDPRISGPAINAFRDGVRAAFTEAGVADEILK